MRKVLITLILFLSLSGVALVALPLPDWSSGWEKGASLLHIWGGLFFLVIFPLYAWDHVAANRHRLRKLGWLTASGSTQLLGAGAIIVSGLLLLAYGGVAWSFLRNFHHGLTYLLLLSLVVHRYSPKGTGR